MPSVKCVRLAKNNFALKNDNKNFTRVSFWNVLAFLHKVSKFVLLDVCVRNRRWILATRQLTHSANCA